jgi:hypothetical protein
MMCEGETTCHALVPDGGFVLPSDDAGTVAPMPMGGMLANGQYNLTAINVYGGGSPKAQKTTLLLQNGTLQSVSVSSTPDGGCLYDRQTAMVSTDAGMFIFTPTCPVGSTAAAPYTATPTAFKLYPSATLEQVYTKQ